MSGLSHINDEYILIYRYKTHGHRFELLCRREEVKRFVCPELGRLLFSVVDDDAVLAKVLQKPTVFFNAKKKEIATQSSLQEAFGPKATVREIILQILSKGEIVETQRDRDSSKNEAESIREEILKTLPNMLLNPFSGVKPEPFEVKDAMNSVLQRWKINPAVPLVVEAGYVASQIANKLDCVRIVKKIIFTYNMTKASRKDISLWNDFLISYAPVVTSLDSFTGRMVSSSAVLAAAEEKKKAAAAAAALVAQSTKKSKKASGNQGGAPRIRWADEKAEEIPQQPENDVEGSNDKSELNSEENTKNDENGNVVTNLTEIVNADKIEEHNDSEERTDCVEVKNENADKEEREDVTVVREVLLIDAIVLEKDPLWKHFMTNFSFEPNKFEEIQISDEEIRTFTETIYEAPSNNGSITPAFGAVAALLGKEIDHNGSSAASISPANNNEFSTKPDAAHINPHKSKNGVDVSPETVAAKAQKQREQYEKDPDGLASIVLNRQVGEPAVVMKGNKRGVKKGSHKKDVESDDEMDGFENIRKKGGCTSSHADDLEAAFAKKTHKELQEMCKKNGMSTGGKKDDLVDRLVTYEMNK